MNVTFSDISGISLSLSGLSGIAVAFSNINYREEMKYLQTFDISAGEEKVIMTTLATEPYSIEIIDSDGNVITDGVKKSVAASGTVYMVSIYSVDALSDVKLKILY